MTETMPAFGEERNAAIAELLGWTDLCGDRYPKGFFNGRKYDLPDYCGDDAACFGLLVTLQLQTTPYNTEILRNQGLPCCTVAPARCSNTPFFFYDGYSELSGAAGWRDAITQAAWEALTAANKETE